MGEKQLRLGCSPLSGRVYVGRLDKTGRNFTDGKHEVTGDFIAALVDHLKFHGGETRIYADGKHAFTVTMQEANNRSNEDE